METAEKPRLVGRVSGAVEPLWSTLSDAHPPVAPLAGDETANLLVIGSGLQGLSTALHAARRGLSVRVLEARQKLGEGASGLNGGQVIPGLKYDPDYLREHFGERTASFAAGTADAVFGLIREEQLPVAHSRTGWIQAAHTETALRAAEDRVRQWQARGADVAFLDRAAIAKLTGAHGYLGGWIDRRAGVVDPYAFTMALGGLAVAAGARVATGARVVSLQKRDQRWHAETADGRKVTAPRVVAATNAYSDALVPGLAQTLVWLHSFQIATEVLPPALAEKILPEGQAVSDSRRILVYYRKSPDGRLMLGGRGPMREPASPDDWAHLQRAMLRLYPELQGLGIEKRWYGRVAMTPDHLPHIHEPEPGLVAVAGCQGRGVGLMTAMGSHLAAYAVSGDSADLPLPITPIRPIPFHRFRMVGVAATIAWYRFRDSLER
jgi:glycine/D-amino acid oxidase-like deaminating enzyme